MRKKERKKERERERERERLECDYWYRERGQKKPKENPRILAAQKL